MYASSGNKPTAAATERKMGQPTTAPAVTGPHPWAIAPKGRGRVAQGPIRRMVRTRSDDAAESGRTLVSSMMEPIALTQSSPDARGAGRPIGLQLLKPKRARAGKEDPPGSPRTTFLGF